MGNYKRSWVYKCCYCLNEHLSYTASFLIAGKVKRDRLISHNKKQIPKKFSNARWIYQQIQNKIVPSSSRRDEERIHHTVPKTATDNPSAVEDGEPFAFCPLRTSTPNNSQTDPSNPPDLVTVSESTDWQTMGEPTTYAHHSMSLEDNNADNCHSFDRPTNSRATIHMDQDMNWQTLFPSDFEMDQNFTFRTSHPVAAPPHDDKETEDVWESCFAEEPHIDKTRSTSPASANPHRREKRKRKDSNKENVAIKNVKKLIMYVNNY